MTFTLSHSHALLILNLCNSCLTRKRSLSNSKNQIKLQVLATWSVFGSLIENTNMEALRWGSIIFQYNYREILITWTIRFHFNCLCSKFLSSKKHNSWQKRGYILWPLSNLNFQAKMQQMCLYYRTVDKVTWKRKQHKKNMISCIYQPITHFLKKNE